ncbi:MAG: PKD domain-containing protein, partial [Anaerolineae bacterium]
AEEIGYWNSIQALQQAEAQAQIEGTNREAAVRNLLLQQSEALREYEIAMAEFDKLAAEHNHLAERRSRLLNKREQVVERVASHNSHLESPAYRIWRDSLTIQSAAAHALAAQFTYLTARASEYELLTPYPNLDEIFRARTANDIRLFLNDLKVWHQALDRPGQLNRYPYSLSLAEDIYQVAQGEMLLDAWGCRIVEDTLECEFSTMLDQRNAADQYLFSPNIWNNRIAGIGAPLASNAGIRVNIVTEQAVNAGNLEVVLIHGEEEGGAEKYRNVLDEIVEYDPGTAVPVGYLIPPGLNPANTTVVVRPDVNGQGGLANSGLVNLSVASSWILRIPADSRGDLDYAGIKDIEIYLDSTGRALPGWEAEAAEDAARLAAGLAMAPLSEARLREMAAPPSSAPGGPGLSLTHLAGRTLAPTIPGQIGGAYRGNLIITSPITVAVQLLNVDLWNDDGTLSGTVNVTDTALYSGSIGLRGTAAGDAFTLTSDQYSAVVAGRQVTQCFALAGHIVDSGDVLKAAYTGTITNLLPFPIVVQGSYSASRPAAPGSKRLLVGAPTWSVPAQASVPITGTLLDEAMELMTATQRISFTTDAGTVTPAAIDTVGGRAVVTFTAPAEPGEAVIVATTGEVTGWVRLQIESNGRPIADAGADQEVVPGDTVTLDGSGSSDPDGDPLIYSWVQTGGEAVSFTPTLSVTAFTAPAAGGPLTFALTVTDTAGLTDTDTTVVTVTNVVPLADAGPDQTVDPGATVTLDGSGSSDPNGDPLIYGWVQTGGEVVSFTPTLSVTAFTAPAASGPLTFSLTVTDTDGFTDADTTVVTVTNRAPLADAGPDQAADPGAIVTLDGSGSSDSNGDPLIYGWAQTGGEAVSFTPTLSVTAFTAPGSGGLLTFTLTVTDSGGLTDSDTTLVVMSNVVPLADAGPDQTVDPGDTVTLDGSASSDANGDPLTYGWIQASGQPISFTEDISITTFTAPPSSGPLTFTLTVTDTGGLTDTDTTVITVAKTRRYLPVILKGYPPIVPAPDLVVTTATVHSNDVQVVIENQGDAPVLPDTPFWIDVYVAPDPAPTGVNQPWNALCEQGLVWGIPAEALPLDAGEAMTLTYSTDPGAPNLYYWDELSNFPGSLADRTPVYVQVDSWHPGTTYGAVLEGHELVGSPYNNIVGPVYATAGSGGMGAGQTGTQAPGRHLPASPDGLPPRP